MSAYVVSKAHIDAMVTACLQEGQHNRPHVPYVYTPEGGVYFTRENADKIGQYLTTTIVEGVSHRYPDDDVSKGELPGPVPPHDYYNRPYAYEPTRPMTDGEIVALVRNYSYQASEHEHWHETIGSRICDALDRAVLSRVQGAFERENGRELPWSFEEENVRGQARV